MKTFLDALLQRPASAPDTLSRYTHYNGVFYMAVGALLYLWPTPVYWIFQLPEPQGYEEGFLRCLGIPFMVIGWFYIFGARTQQRSFSLSTVVDRMLLPLRPFPTSRGNQAARWSQRRT